MVIQAIKHGHQEIYGQEDQHVAGANVQLAVSQGFLIEKGRIGAWSAKPEMGESSASSVLLLCCCRNRH